MNPKKPLGRSEMPLHLLETAEFDAMEGRPIDPDQYGRLERQEVVLPLEDIDCAVPYLVLTVRLPGEGEPLNPDLLALDVYHLITALSDYEKALGGRGLRLHDKAAEADTITLTLAPVFGEGAADRLTKITAFLAEQKQSPPEPANGSTKLLASLEEAMTSPAERCKLLLTRRRWVVAAQVELQVSA